jgi:hypothetical protein
MSDTTRSPGLAEVIRFAIQRQLSSLRFSMPARIESYDATKQSVSVQPLIKQAYEDEEGERQVERLPVISNVPVCFPRAGGYRVTFPVAVGDTCLLVFSDASLDIWLSQGGEVDPLDDRRNALSDAIAILGLYDFGAALTDAPTDCMTLGADNGPQIYIDQSGIKIGSSTPADLEAAALGDSIASHLASLRTWLNALTLPVAGATAGPPAVPSPVPPTVVSASVKVKK